MKQLAFCLLVLSFLSTTASAQSMSCVSGRLNIHLSSITPATGALVTSDKVLVAKGKFSENGPSRTSTRTVFVDGRVKFETITLMVAIIIQHDINFTSIVKHKTTSKNGEWSTYEVGAGLFTKTKTPTYLEVNNFSGTAMIIKTQSKANAWKCN